jgi:hypothetical protein
VPFVVGALEAHRSAVPRPVVLDGYEEPCFSTDRNLVRRRSQIDLKRSHRALRTVPQDDGPGCQQDAEGDGDEHVLLDSYDTSTHPQSCSDGQKDETSAGGAETPSGARHQDGEDPYCDADRDIHRAPLGEIIWSRSCRGDH